MKKLLSKLLIFGLVIALLSTQTVGVFAQSANELRAIFSDSPYFDPTSSGCDQTSTSAGCTCSVLVAPALNGNDNPEKIWNFLISKGLTPIQSAGVMGNLQIDSHFNPAYAQQSQDETIAPGALGFGLANWSLDRRADLEATAVAKGVPASDLAFQLDYLFSESNTRVYQSLNEWEGLKKQTTVSGATLYWHLAFEASTETIAQIQDRITAANEALTKYGSLVNGSNVSGYSSDCSSITGPGENTKYIDGFTVYSQIDNSWKNKPYGSSTIGLAGCGPTAMAMIITALTGEAVGPVEAADYATAHRMYIDGVGSSWSIASVLATHWGLNYQPLPNKNAATVIASLQAGALIIGAGGGAKPFTVEGHYIVIRGVTSSGKFKIADSYHPDTSDQEWDPGQILEQMSLGSMYAITK